MTEANVIRVLIVDDQPVVRSGLGAFLLAFPDLELVGEAANGQEAIRLCDELQPDVVLMDLIMPVMDGVEAIRQLAAQHPEIGVLALSSFGDDDLVRRAMQAGAVGYLLKNVSHIALAEAIRAAHAGRPTLAPEAAQALIRATRQPQPPGHDLTPRERQVLALMAKGLSNLEIAARLTIGEATVKTHVSNIIAKLGASSRTEAVALAIRQSLVT
jgi:two-component system, NarL family, response regulator LiaR